MDLIELLKARRFFKDASDPEGLRERLGRGPLTFYTGYDPTADSLTIGNLVPLMMQAHIQREGHKPIVVMGGGTALLGDPSGKSATREHVLSHERIKHNIACQRPQLERFLGTGGENGVVLLNNADWLGGWGYIDFLRDVGRHFSVNEMLQAETYAARLREQKHLSFVEFNYRLVQAFDFLHLKREHGCELQCGGSDQWGNCVAGTELIRKSGAGKAWVITAPLLMTAGGQKMGKTEEGSVWLSAARTSPYRYFQYWLNVDDQDVGKLLRMFTFLPLPEIERLEALRGAEIRQAKRILATEATRLAHGEAETQKAAGAAKALFGGGGESADVPTVQIELAEIEDGLPLFQLFQLAGLSKSGGEARRLAKQGGARINDEQVRDANRRFFTADLRDGALLLRAGKKRYCKLLFR